MRFGLAFVLFFLSTTAFAQWKLDAANSTLSFVSIKKNEIGETNYFRQFDAKIEKNGDFVLEVALDSVDTRYKIRDERMRGLFFETNSFPKATIAGNVRYAKIDAMHAGKMERMTLDAMLDLHGHKEKISAELRVIKLDKNRFLVTTESPIILNVQAFDLTEGVNRLMEAAQLESISWVVPVSFVLVFTK